MRRLVLPNDLLELPQIAREISAATTDLLATQEKHEKRFDRVDEDIAELKSDVSVLKNNMRSLKGQALEDKFREHPFAR